MGKTRRHRLAAAVAVACAAVAGSGVVAPAVAKPIAAPADLNGDGYQDLVVPSPTADVGTKRGAGAVVVLYGSRTGVSTLRKAVITQDTAGVPDAAEPQDLFGASTAFADLDKDGYSDLVVGAPDEDLAGDANAGGVTVLWGGRNGLAAASGLPVPVVKGGRYGLDVAAVRDTSGPRVLVGGYDGSIEFSGTFTRDGSVGTSQWNRDTASVAVTDYAIRHDGRAVRIITTVRVGGYSGGLVYVDPATLSDPLRIDGTTTAVGDVNGDGHDDLVVGDPDEPISGTYGHKGGQITLWYGGANGFAAAPVRITQDTAGVPGTSTRYNNFGTAVAVADLNKDGLGDIVVGVPGQTQNGQGRAGAVVVIPGKRTGTPGAGSYQISQETASVPGVSEQGDTFGSTLAVGDVRADGRIDVIIGAECEDRCNGAVWVLPGSATGPTGTGSVELTAGKLGLAGEMPQVGGFQPS
ncbi:FG-GAP-like repeat-containing protein [Streptomyces sp. NBC_00259]|uniref:FG-GAP-like repeat-containing protein n=1 Tax=Streptomyces sp. NBC_00259 TaxID=2903643 RepID=UPI002E2D34C1|nr:FG-GAP-like repeat-containing protein [Streptomyces sp. NBC_00259]